MRMLFEYRLSGQGNPIRSGKGQILLAYTLLFGKSLGFEVMYMVRILEDIFAYN